MLQPTSRISDWGIGYCAVHGFQIGTIITGDPSTLIALMPNANMGDIVLASCGHWGVICHGNYTLLDTLRPSARVGDIFVGVFSGDIITGDPFTLT